MKNVLIACAVAVALVIAYKIGTTSNTPKAPASSLENKSNDELKRRVRDAERKLEITRLQESERFIFGEIEKIEQRIQKDEQRIFKRISRMELMNLSVQVTEYRRQLAEINQKLKELGDWKCQTMPKKNRKGKV